MIAGDISPVATQLVTMPLNAFADSSLPPRAATAPSLGGSGLSALATSGPEAYGLAGSWSPAGGPNAHPALGRMAGDEPRSPVLVVDDDRAIRDSLRMVLEDAGYAVIEAGDGLEAMGVLRGTPRAMVVLLDIMMPRMSGEDVVREVARDDRLRETLSIVVLTANRHALTPSFLGQLQSLRIPILDKPPDIDDVIAHVTRAEQRLDRER
jgi:CheY-like chemotaxis protein